MMKVIFANRKDCMTSRGGDTVQMLLTKKYLEANHPLEVELCFEPGELRSKKADLVHIFNVQTFKESRAFLETANEMKCKTAISPIYWNMGYAVTAYAMTLLSLYKPRSVFRSIAPYLVRFTSGLSRERYLSRNYRKEIRYLLDHADVILPNSDTEKELLIEHFQPAAMHGFRVIPNAIELMDEEVPSALKKEENLIIQVGRISAAKNQAGTLHAAMDQPRLKVLIIGKVDEPRYDDYLHKIAGKRGNVEFIREIPQEALMRFYKEAAVHMNPSFRDSPGLVTLEAFYQGCEIVVSEPAFVPLHYYRFDKEAHICNPFSVSSIRDALNNALVNKKNTGTDNKDYFSFFNYRTVAELTYEAYLSAIKP